MKLRIISGSLKGRYINVPQLKTTRPTTDRVKETVFNILWNHIDLDGINVLDLYSGSGSLGFEAASRGASGVDFVEDNFNAAKVIEANIKQLELENICAVFKRAVTSFIAIPAVKPYDLILADPPFFKDDIYEAVNNIFTNKLLSDSGLLFIERSVQTLSKDKENLGVEPYKRAGDACLYFIRADRSGL